jgi:hypothetical protein
MAFMAKIKDQNIVEMQDMEDGQAGIISSAYDKKYQGMLVHCYGKKIVLIGATKEYDWEVCPGNTNQVRLISNNEEITLKHSQH